MSEREVTGSATLGDALVNVLREHLAGGFPHGPRGRTLITVADFSGTHVGSLFTTYAFLTLDLDRNQEWLDGQRQFRKHMLPRRRMAYKALNDAARRKALLPFLNLANRITGALTVVIIPADFGKLTSSPIDDIEMLFAAWKPKVHEHLIRVTHLGGLMTAFLSRPHQNVLFIVDQDEIASNVAQLTELTKVLSRVLGNCLDHSLRHVRVGTTLSDDGSLALEDLAAIADLAAGAAWEMMSAISKEGWLPVKGVVAPLPRTMARKARVVGQWLIDASEPLRRSLLLFEPAADGHRDRISRIALQPMSNAIITPRPW